MAITRIGNPALADVREPNFRNIIINGSMDLAQRGTSLTGETSGGYYTTDRFRYSKTSTAPTLNHSQSTDVPTGQGFFYSRKLEVTTVDAPASNEWSLLEQRIEGQNLQYLKKGTSSAESLTASFWVKATKTGTYIVRLNDTDNTRQISKSYTINSSNTWEKKTITFAGDTSGTLDNDNAESLSIEFVLQAGTDYTSGTLATSWESTTNANSYVGQVDTFDTLNNTFFLTGVQLEAGSVASDFEFLPVDVNLQRCQRYYQIIADRNETGERMAITCGSAINSANVYAGIQFITLMRASATAISTSVSAGYRFLGDTQPTFDSISADPITNRGARLTNGDSATVTAGKAYVFELELANSTLRFEAELW